MTLASFSAPRSWFDMTSIWDVCDNMLDFDNFKLSAVARQDPARSINADGSHTITLLLPGVKRERIEVVVDDHRLLTVSIDVCTDSKSCSRQFRYHLPQNLNESEIVATHVDGVLTITVPVKKKDDTTVHRIAIE